MYEYKKYNINGKEVTCVFDKTKPNIEKKIDELFKKYVEDKFNYESKI